MTDAPSTFKLRWDGVVTAGHLLTAMSVIVMGLVWGLRLEGRVNQETAVRRARDSALEQQIQGVSNENSANMAVISGQLSRISIRLDQAIARLPGARP
ncbi:MAG: hypothetical protein HIU82_02050 [Proteobacteria bacterium]|nr:hypothetical protein [Pseudomonadota bacterium]